MLLFSKNKKTELTTQDNQKPKFERNLFKTFIDNCDKFGCDASVPICNLWEFFLQHMHSFENAIDIISAQLSQIIATDHQQPCPANIFLFRITLRVRQLRLYIYCVPQLGCLCVLVE